MKLNYKALSFLLFIVVIMISSCSKTESNNSAIYAPILEVSKKSLDPIKDQVKVMLENVNYAILNNVPGLSSSSDMGYGIKDKTEYKGYSFFGDKTLQKTKLGITESFNLEIERDKEKWFLTSSVTLSDNSRLFIGSLNNNIYTDEMKVPYEFSYFINLANELFNNEKDVVSYENSYYDFSSVTSLYSKIDGKASKVFSIKEKQYNVNYDVILSTDVGSIHIELSYTEDLKGEIEPISLLIDSVLYNPYEAKSIIENNQI